MGFDLFGVSPVNEKGSYFRNTVWYWGPLWTYVCKSCSDFLTETEMEQGHWNNGFRIIRRKSLKIYQRLSELIDSGAVQQEIIEYNQSKSELPLEECFHCNGSGSVDNEHGSRQCTICDGTGVKENSLINFDLEESNVRDFAEFCKLSGGFFIY